MISPKALDDLIEKSKERWAAMSAQEREEMLKAQRESWVRAEMDWPKPKFHWEGVTKVYESYEDYCND